LNVLYYESIQNGMIWANI